jgi:hypothetical protein
MPVPDRRPVLHWTADVSTFFQGVFRRKAAVIVLVVAALGLGVFRFSTMPTEFLPEMENPEVTVSVIGPGYDAASMEKLVTNPLENSLAAVKGKPTCFPCPETDFRKSICSSIPGRTWMQEARSFPDGAGRNGLGQHVDGQQRGRSPLRLGSIADARQLHGSIDRGNRRGSGGRSRVVHNEERMTIREALLEAAGTRMRPILMTATATVGAMVPLVFGSTETGSVVSQNLAIVVIGGLTVATLLTLVFVRL